MVAATLRQEAVCEALQKLPTVARSEHFPYQLRGKACFVCEDPIHDRKDMDTDSACNRCGARAHVEQGNVSRKDVVKRKIYLWSSQKHIAHAWHSGM